MQPAKVITALISIILLLTIANFIGILNLYGKFNSLTGEAVAAEEQELLANDFDDEQQKADNELQEQEEQQRIKVSADDDPAKGSADAAVTIIEFSDFECPYSARFSTQTLPLIEENYIKTGKVIFVFRDFPLSFHQNAQKAAQAAACANEQGKFWEYHDKLFENQQFLDIASLKQYAQDLELDSEKFNNCLDSGKMTSEIRKDLRDAQNYGVTGTPSIFINGILVKGAQPYSALRKIIEQELDLKQ